MILVLGDLHGEFNSLKSGLQKKEITDCTIIQVGDFGIGFYPREDINILKSLNSFLKKKNIILYAIRGNHDDKHYFKGNHIFSNLKLLPDYTELKIEDHNILFVGGAVSVDRRGRLLKMQESASLGIAKPSYWFDEYFVLDENKLKDIKNIDMVVTHTTPEWCYPDNRNGFNQFVLNFSNYDDYLLTDLTKEREQITKMFDILKENGNIIEKHYYGHFHKSEITIHEKTTHYLLDISELRMVDEFKDYEEILNKQYS